VSDHNEPQCPTCGRRHELSEVLTPKEAEWLAWVRRDLAELIREIEGDDPPAVKIPLVEQ
jgi:hypothetical protein